MDRWLPTSLGELRVSGRPEAFEPGRPLLLVLRGAFADDGQYASLEDLLPEFRVVFGEMPGFRSPRLAEQSVDAFCQAWSEALALLQGPICLCGVSLGGVVALGLQPRGQVNVLAIDPPFRAADAAALAQLHPPIDTFEASFLRDIFGWDAAGDTPRDYLGLLERLACPAVVLAGSDAGQGVVPGLIADETLALIQTHPLIRARRIPGVGHDVARGGSQRVLTVLRNMARAAAGA